MQKHQCMSPYRLQVPTYSYVFITPAQNPTHFSDMYFFIFFMQRCYDGQNAHTTSMHIILLCTYAHMRIIPSSYYAHNMRTCGYAHEQTKLTITIYLVSYMPDSALGISQEPVRPTINGGLMIVHRIFHLPACSHSCAYAHIMRICAYAHDDVCASCIILQCRKDEKIHV